MEKILVTFAIGLLAVGGTFAAPRLKSIDNRNGKTTIKIEIPASDRDTNNGLSVDNVTLYNNGKTLGAKKVDAIWGDDSTIILEFKKLKLFKDCTLSLTVNGVPVCMDLQSILTNR